MPSMATLTISVPTRDEWEVGGDVAERAGRLRRETGVRLPDALIAATAIEHKLSLFTRNRSEFEKVARFRLRDIG